MGSAICAEQQHQPPAARIQIEPEAKHRVGLATSSLPLVLSPKQRAWQGLSLSGQSSPKSSARGLERTKCQSLRLESSPRATHNKTDNGKRKKRHRSGSPSSKQGVCETPRSPAQRSKRGHAQKGRGSESCTLAKFQTSDHLVSKSEILAQISEILTPEPDALQISESPSPPLPETGAKEASNISRESSVGILTSRSVNVLTDAPSPVHPIQRKGTRRPTPYYVNEYLDSDPEVGVEAELPSMALLKKHEPAQGLAIASLAA